MKIIHTKETGTGYITGRSETGSCICIVEFLHNDFCFYFPEKVLQPYLVHNTLYEAILHRKGEWK